MPLCGPPPNPYVNIAAQFPQQPRSSALVGGDKLERLRTLQENCNQFLAQRLNQQRYKSAKEFVAKSIRTPTAPNIEEAFEATISCAETIARYLVLKDQIFGAILSLVDGVTCMYKFSASIHASALTLENSDVVNSLHLLRDLCDILFQFNNEMTRIYPSNDIASYKRMANQINNDKAGRFRDAITRKAIESNEGDMKRLKDVEVQYDISGMFPVFKTAGQYWNFQYDDQFRPTPYKISFTSDSETLQQRVAFLVAAAQCFMLQYGESRAASFCLTLGHQFQVKIDNETHRQNVVSGPDVDMPGILDKRCQYELLELLTQLRTKLEFELVKDALGSAVGLKDTKTKEAKLLQ